MLLDFVQILGLPLALVALYIGQRDTRRSNDLLATLQLSESFRAKWEASWRDALEQLEAHAARGEATPDNLASELRDMLNWLDWIGVLIESRALGRPRTILMPLREPARRIIQVGQSKIAEGERSYGPQYWSGLRRVESFITSGRGQTRGSYQQQKTEPNRTA